MRADSPRCHHTLPLHTVHRVLPHGHNQHDCKQQRYTYTNAYEEDANAEETRVFIPAYERKAQKGHNGPRSQIGVYNEVSRGVE